MAGTFGGSSEVSRDACSLLRGAWDIAVRDGVLAEEGGGIPGQENPGDDTPDSVHPGASSAYPGGNKVSGSEVGS